MRIVSEPFLHAQDSVNMAPRHFKKLATDGIQDYFNFQNFPIINHKPIHNSFYSLKGQFTHQTYGLNR